MSLDALAQLTEQKEVRLPKIDQLGRSYGTGRRKNSYYAI